jgi:hypothetical protein
MDTAKELLEFKLQNEEVRIQHLISQLEDFFLENPEERLQNSSQIIYLQFRLQKIYQIWLEEFDLKKEILFPSFRKYFPKREKELFVLSEEMKGLKKDLYELIVLIHKVLKSGALSEKSNEALKTKIIQNGNEMIVRMSEYFRAETKLIDQELFQELREDEAEAFFRKIVERQKKKLFETESRNSIP